ncbi:MAG: hypothetical protein AAB543_06030 [Pseudomonadota bacterium]
MFSARPIDAASPSGRRAGPAHIRFIVDKPKTAERLAAKKAQATALGGAFIDL